VDFNKAKNEWNINTKTEKYTCSFLVVATSRLRVPYIPSVEKAEEFEGLILHTSKFKNAKEFQV
jgi:indole-3-pyruvate monooxygenase